MATVSIENEIKLTESAAEKLFEILARPNKEKKARNVEAMEAIRRGKEVLEQL